MSDQRAQVAGDVLLRVERHQQVMDKVVELLRQIPNDNDRMAVVAAVTHMEICCQDSNGERLFDRMLDSLLFTIEPDPAVRAAFTVHNKA